MSKASARWVPMNLIDHGHVGYVTTSQEFVDLFESDPVKFVSFCGRLLLGIKHGFISRTWRVKSS